MKKHSSLSFFLLSLFLVTLFPACSDQTKDIDTETQTPLSQQELKIFIDPVTGRPTAPPPASSVPRARLNDLNTQPQDLLVEPAPGGGSMVDLKGRFRSSSTASVGEDGKLSIEHHSSSPVLHSAPASAPKK